jgi:hypothetical protein
MKKVGGEWQSADAAARGHRRRPRGTLLLLALAAMSGLALPRVTFAKEPVAGPLTVLVYNYRRASPQTLAQAEREAGAIFTEAGVRTVWLDCPVRAAMTDPPKPCQGAKGASVVTLRILAGHVQDAFLDSVSGFATAPALAAVYYDHTPPLPEWDTYKSDVAVVLGCVIAHEIGHLLLGPHGHSVHGIMQGRWDSEQIKLALMGKLLLLPEESKVMQGEVRARIEPRRDNVASVRSAP